MDEPYTDELEQIAKGAAEITKLSRAIVKHDFEDRAHGILHHAMGALEVLRVYLEVELEREP